MCAALACCAPGAAAGHPPTARIAITPAYVSLDDGYRTEVTLDGTASADPLDDPTASAPLGYLWRVEDAAAAPAPDERAPKITVRVAGTRAVAVHLTVSDADDARSTVTAYIGVSVPQP